VPVSHEDDALRAVRAAWEMRTAVDRLTLQARIGVNTGEVVAGEGDTLVTGDAVNVAARLEQAAEPGEVLIGADTHRLVRDAVTAEPRALTAKGKPSPVPAFNLISVDPDAAAIARRLDTPLIGRFRELDQLQHAFERAVGENRCHLFTLLGAAGVGKSRLTSEFLSNIDARVLHGRCLDYGEGITFWPVVSVLKQMGERANETLEHIASGGLSQSELFWDVRAQLEQVAADRPLVVVFDDIHWGEPTFLDLLDHVADLSRGAPILLLCLARPELLDLRPAWAGGKLNATTMLLEPLSTDECGALIDVHGDGIGAATRSRILAAADGNPLFVEEMVALARENDDVRVPSSVQALLQARLDQLGADERDVIERGAVEGQVFHRGAVRELSRGSEVETHLVGLVRKELITPEATTFVGDHAFRFRHLLIRDAAYEALPKETRADLHERFADWLAVNGRDLLELDEVLGHHLEQSARYRRELGRSDVELERRAAEPLAAAGHKATARDDLPAARNLFGRALELLPPGDEARAPIILQHVSAVVQSGDFDAASSLIAELEQHRDERLKMYGRLERLELRMATDPIDVIPEAEGLATEALRLFEASGDERGQVRAWMLVFGVEWMQSRARPALAALERVMELAVACGEPAIANRAITSSAGPLLYGPFRPDEIRLRFERLRAHPSPLAEQAGQMMEAHLLRLQGRFDEALEIFWRADELRGQLGVEVIRSVLRQWPAEVDVLRGRPAQAVLAFREIESELARLRETSFRSTILIQLAYALYADGKPEEAEQRAIEGEELGAVEDIVNFAYGRALRARIAADRGAGDEAERLAREALEFASPTDFPVVHAAVHAATAWALARAGRLEDANAALGRAVALYESIGDLFQAKQTSELLSSL
jgi:tetratricopeptide (TPR) repeat protein